MSVELASRLILTRNEAVAALVSDRVTFGIAAQGERRPRVVLTMTSSQHEHTMAGHAGYVTGTIEAACLAPDYPTVKALAAAVIDALDEYEGPVTGVADLDVSYITVDEESDIPVDVPEGAASPSTVGVSINFSFMIKR